MRVVPPWLSRTAGNAAICTSSPPAAAAATASVVFDPPKRAAGALMMMDGVRAAALAPTCAVQRTRSPVCDRSVR